jgi:hypothetical protein
MKRIMIVFLLLLLAGCAIVPVQPYDYGPYYAYPYYYGPPAYGHYDFGYYYYPYVFGGGGHHGEWHGGHGGGRGHGAITDGRHH